MQNPCNNTQAYVPLPPTNISISYNRILHADSISTLHSLPFTSPFHRPQRHIASASVSNTNITEIIITRPDDWHLHVRDGPVLSSVVPHSAKVFNRAIIMPNLVPPVTTAEHALAYKSRIIAAIPPGSSFTPLMTLYLTDNTSPSDVYAAKEAGVVAFKLYPTGATTNSQSGVTEWKKCIPTLKAMEEVSNNYLAILVK